jgi:hypothetical protein
MEALLFVVGWIFVGILTAIGFGRIGLFDYTPTGSQVKPSVLLYMTTFAWPVFWLLLLGGLVRESVSWINRTYKRVAKVRH